MASGIGGSYEMQILFCAAALGIVQLLLAVTANVTAGGLGWGASPRDDARPKQANYVGRLDRAYRNFVETFPFFAIAVLLAHALGKSTHNSVLGAQLYIWARVLYVPAYVIAIPLLRTAIWFVALVGIVMVLSVSCSGL